MGRNDAKMDYETIYDLYGINKNQISKNEERRIRKNLTSWLKIYLQTCGYSEELSLYDLRKSEQDYFICYEIKEKMINTLPYAVSNNKIENKLKEYMRDSLVEGERYLKERNSVIERIKKRDYVGLKDNEPKKKQAYQEFCETWKYFFHTQPPTFESFLKRPNLSVYDYMKSKEFGIDVEDKVDKVTLNIVLEVLKEKLGLEIDFEAIENCIIEASLNRYDGEFDVSFYDDEKFPLTFQEYWDEQIDGDKSEFSDEEIKAIEDDYNKLRTFFINQNKYHYMFTNLKQFYKTK